MIELIALILALVFSCFLLLFVMHAAFVRGVGWFDERDTRRELERRRHRQERTNRLRTRPRAEVKAAVRPVRSSGDDDEWSEFIDV